MRKNKLGLPDDIFEKLVVTYQDMLRILCKFGIMTLDDDITDLSAYKIAVPSYCNIDGKSYKAEDVAALAKQVLSDWSNLCGEEEVHILYRVTDQEWDDEKSIKAIDEFNAKIKENPYFPFGEEIFE